jgi:hypothetical protein
MAITFERRLTSARSFGVFHTSLRSIWHTGLKHRADLTVASVSSLALGYKSSKVIRAFEGRANETHPIEVYLISPGSTLCTEAQLEKDISVGRAPSSDTKRKLSFRSNL